MKKPDGDDSRTIETRLECPQHFATIEAILKFYAHCRHSLWKDLIDCKSDINVLKSVYIRKFGLLGRQFNSLAKEVVGKAKALQELRNLKISELEEKIKILTFRVGTYLSRISEFEKKLSTIECYREKIRIWKVDSKKGKKVKSKPKMPVKIKRIDRKKLVRSINQIKFLLHQKKRRLADHHRRLQNLKNNDDLSICFGTKSLFKKQFNLDAAGFTSHQEWKQTWELARSSQAYYVGSSDEAAGNQNFQYNPTTKSVSIRLPNARNFEREFLIIENIEFPEHLYSEFLFALSRPDHSSNKNRKAEKPVTYRLLRRVDSISGTRAYYIQASFEVRSKEVFTNCENGAIGVDINNDHLALAEIDASGNLIDTKTIPFDFSKNSSEQTAAQIGDIVAVAISRCIDTHKPLVVEELDFHKKKTNLRELDVVTRKRLSSFAYSSFLYAFKSRCRREGIGILPINPEYTSLIGAYKFQGLNISSHKKAALVIARRGLDFSEAPRAYRVTFPAHELMQEKVGNDPKHVRKFYRDNRQAIKKLFNYEKRPPQASKFVLSFSKHKTLIRSYCCERGPIDFDSPGRESV